MILTVSLLPLVKPAMSETRTTLSTEHADSKDESVSLLIFRAGEGGPKAVPLALIARLEEIDLKTSNIPTAIRWSNIVVL